MGVDEAGAGDGVRQLLTQLAHVDVDRALLLAERPSPHDGVELLAAYYASPAARERREQLQLADRQRQRGAVGEGHELGRADLEPPDAEDLLRLLRGRFHSFG